MNYSFKKTLYKGLKYLIIFGLPFLVDQFIVAYPEWAQLTVGGGVVMLANWGKHWAQIKWL